MEELKSEVITMMRSCMTSNQQALNLVQLTKDYKTLVGENIPYQKLGFRKLEDFIRSAPNEFNLTKSGQEMFVRAVKSEKTAHIAEMVAKQKTAKKKPLKRRPMYYRNTPPPRLQNTSKWRPKSNTPNKFQMSTRPQQVRHSQFINKGPTQAPLVMSKVVVPEHSTFNKPHQSAPVTAPPAAIKGDLNQRLTNRTRGSNTNNSVNGNAAPVNSNGTSRLNGRLGPVPSEPKTKEQTVINDNSLNPLMSTRKRLIKKMSELNLERDSGNSSPTSDMSSPPLYKSVDFVRTGDPLVDLKNFAELHKLGDVKVDIAQLNQKRNKFYSCKIKVGSKYTYTSYPSEHLNPLSAQSFCCEEALSDLIPKFKRKSLMIASEKDILDRIPPMLEKHPHGIWASQLTLDYADKYNEVLPDDWIQIVDASPCIQIEKVSEDYILRHCLPGDKGQRLHMEVPVYNVSVPSNTIQAGEGGRLVAHVTCANSANEIWCQQSNTEDSEIYAEMIDRLQVYYQAHEPQLIPKNISQGHYVAKCEGIYYRVRAVKVNEIDIDCFLIDWGDELSVPKSEIFELKREYATAQAQAFVCRLYGLEDLYEISTNSQSLSCLYENPVIVEIVSDLTDNENTLETPVIMYDIDTGKSINEHLISELTVELASPTLQLGINDVYVSNIESNGDVYIQLRSRGYEKWETLKRQIEEEVNKKPPKEFLYTVTRENSRDKLYFLKVEGEWHRVRAIDWSPGGDYAQIYFVDIGRADVIKVADEELYPLEPINDVFNSYPCQALKVRMSLDQIPTNLVELASKLIAKDEPVMLKTEGTTTDNIPLAKLFKRNPDDGLFCINASIALETEVIKKEENNNVKSKFRLGQDCVPSTGTLKCPELPKVDDDYPVYIPFVVSPYNFFVQPVESKQKLNEMMHRLQERYENVLYGNLKVDQVLPGSVYASKHDDGFWYRTSVIKVIHAGSVSVFYCDFGYYQTLPVKQLIPLDKEFMELPYQALKAKLAEVKPIQNKWTMVDCEEFKKMIEKKHFFSFLRKIEKDILYESDLVLKIVLVDTSSDQDINIGNEMIARRMADPE